MTIDRKGDAMIGQARKQRDQPRGVIAGRGVSRDEKLDTRWLDTGVLQGLEEDGRREILDAARAMQAAESSVCGAARGDDVGLCRGH